MMPKTWILLLSRTAQYKDEHKLPPTIIGGYATEREAFDVGLAACELRLCTADELEQSAKDSECHALIPGCDKAMWLRSAVHDRAMIAELSNPILLYKKNRRNDGNNWLAYPFTSTREPGTGHAAYAWFDTLAGSAS